MISDYELIQRTRTSRVGRLMNSARSMIVESCPGVVEDSRLRLNVVSYSRFINGKPVKFCWIHCRLNDIVISFNKKLTLTCGEQLLIRSRRYGKSVIIASLGHVHDYEPLRRLISEAYDKADTCRMSQKRIPPVRVGRQNVF